LILPLPGDTLRMIEHRAFGVGCEVLHQAQAKIAEQGTCFSQTISLPSFFDLLFLPTLPSFPLLSAVKGFLSLAKGVQSLAMIPQDLLDILVCPVCKKPLALKDEGQSLKCGACRRAYPIRDDIPILLVDEAVTEAS
jgi:uncharacterized protein YbaR (Trm112 family)